VCLAFIAIGARKEGVEQVLEQHGAARIEQEETEGGECNLWYEDETEFKTGFDEVEEVRHRYGMVNAA
jgi:hypothetical protein